ncbi:MAG TPA: hypothetical protein VHX36_13200 [Candidatus Acidoferrales bacterium]|jgi:hypothetical protein|nr:hypothetical protein [Candidatus Acidoferrales bacterium]
MDVRSTLVLAAALALAADLSGVTQLRPGSPGLPAQSLSDSDVTGSISPVPAAGGQDTSKHSKSVPLQGSSRILLIRYVDGEFAKAVQPLASGRKGFKVRVGKPINKQSLSDAVRLYGLAASPGDVVQITGMEFRTDEILIQINGGGKKHFHLRDHLQFGVGDLSSPPPPSAPQQPAGATLVLDYGRPLPDMNADDLKHDLGVFLDFSKEHSAAVNWIDTIPPQFKDAIQDHRAVVGMDSEMVLAAMGRPDHKVRERDPSGTETEDWIYGSPPARTTFVTFVGDNVIRVKAYD